MRFFFVCVLGLKNRLIKKKMRPNFILATLIWITSSICIHGNPKWRQTQTLDITTGPSLADFLSAGQHLHYVISTMPCVAPREKVVKVKDCYPYVTGDFYPSSTILNECSETSGCCVTSHVARHHGDDVVCAPAQQELVTMYFHVCEVDGSQRVQSLAFVNHTRCECVQTPPAFHRLANEHPEVLCPERRESYDFYEEPR